MKGKNFLFPIFLLINLISFAQQKIEGKIIDENSSEPVPFVSVTHVGSQKSTITNEDGQFVMTVEKLPVTIRLSHLSYQGIELSLNDEQPINIKLKPAVITLSEIVIGDPAITLVKNASDKAREQADNTYTGKAFLRQLVYDGGKPFYLNEVFFDVEWKNSMLTRWNPTDARYLQRKNHKSTINYGNIGVLAFAFSGYRNSSFPIRDKPDSLYSFKIEQILNTGNSEIAIVSCKLKSPYPTNKGLIFEGKLYIDKNTYNIVKADGIMRNTDATRKAAQQVRLGDMHILSQYKPDENGNNMLDFSNFHFDVARTVKGITVRNSQFNSTIFILGNEAVNAGTLKAVQSTVSDIELTKSFSASDKFWDNNVVIKRTQKEEQAIKELENQKL